MTIERAFDALQLATGDPTATNGRVPLTTSNPLGGLKMMADNQPTRLVYRAGESDWRDKAACLGTSPALFFPEKGDDNTVIVSKHAKKVCMTCAVRTECLKWAIDNEENHGVWGGLTVRERQGLRRERSAMPNPSAPFAALVWLADAHAHGEVA